MRRGARGLAWTAAVLAAGCGFLVGSGEEGGGSVDTTTGSRDGGADGASVVDTGAPVEDSGGGSDASDASDGGGCVDTQNDPNNCGACGHRCNLDGVCSSGTCDRRVVFVTSATFMGGEFLGLTADGRCSDIAHDAGLTGNYSVWLTLPVQPNRLAAVVGKPYYTTAGSIVSNKWPPGASLTSPLDVDEHGQKLATASYAWTNLTGTGTLAGGLDNCAGWGNSGSNVFGTFGETTATDDRWTQGMYGGSGGATKVPCNTPMHLYCVEYP